METFNKYDFKIYSGTVRGALASTSYQSDSHSYNFGEEKSEVTALEWGETDEIIVGYKSGVVKSYNTLLDKFTKTVQNGKDRVVGVGCSPLLIARQTGIVTVLNGKDVSEISVNLADESSTLESMTQSRFNSNIIGVGGEKNDLKLWDVKASSCVFKAKSLGHDELNLPIPTSVRSICFLQENLVCCATKEGHALLYDQRAQRKPTGKFTEAKASYSVIASTFKEKQCVVGTTKGYIQLIDLRAPAKCVKTYKSFTGGVTGIVCDPVAPFIISTSLDKHLRIHNLESKELLYKKYMKQSLTKLLVRPIVKEESEDENRPAEQNADDQEYEDLFNNMEVVTENIKKRKSATKHTNVKTKKQK